MQININPNNTELSRDMKNYLALLKGPANAEIKKQLRGGPNGGKYPAKPPGSAPDPDAPFETFSAYQDFAFGGNAAASRLGASLNPQIPNSLINLKNPTPNASFPFSRSHDNPPPNPPAGTVTVDANGVVVHDPAVVIKQEDREATDHYMHHIFDHILYESRDLLDDINDKLDKYVSAPGKDTRNDYETAVWKFEEFRGSLKTRSTNCYSQTFNWVTVTPVVTNEGYVVSARVEVNWKNPGHSSSTIRVP